MWNFIRFNQYYIAVEYKMTKTPRKEIQSVNIHYKNVGARSKLNYIFFGVECGMSSGYPYRIVVEFRMTWKSLKGSPVG